MLHSNEHRFLTAELGFKRIGTKDVFFKQIEMRF